MDRTWTKRKKTKARAKKPRRAREKRALSVAKLRIAALTTLAVFILGLVLLSGGSAAQRMAQFALPLLKYVQDQDGSAHDEGTKPITIARVDFDEGVSEQVRMRIEVIKAQKPIPTTLSGAEPRILIYHTHTTEAYTATPGYEYVASGSWRTHENDKNIVAVGELLAKTLREQYGCNVIHDITDHEPPQLRTSYSRSVETMLAYKKKYPSITMFIDVHRDAGKDNVHVTIDGKKVARLMFVVGTGEGATGTGFKEMPDFESNYALANAITERLNADHNGLMRNIRVKTGRYNQHVSNQCLLVEVGDNMSTLEEALNAMPYLARAIVETSMQSVAPVSAPRASPAPSASSSPSPSPASSPTPKQPLQWIPKQ